MLKKTFITLFLFGNLSLTTILVLVHQNKPVNSQTISTTKSNTELVTQNPNSTTNPTSVKNYTGIVKKVNDIAQQISVRLDVSDGSNGTGVIIAREGDTYYVLTARQILCNLQVVSPDCTSNNIPPDLEIVTPDGKSYSLDYQTVELVLGYDALIFSFQSQQNYRVAEIADYPVASNHSQAVFVVGFPKTNNPNRQLKITGGRVHQRDLSSFLTKDSFSRQDISGESLGSSKLASMDSSGFGLVYTNLSFAGMNGGAVLDSQGRLVGINTGTENEIEIDGEGNVREYSIGYSLGVPISNINGYLQSSLRQKPDREIKVESLNLVSVIPPEIKDDSSEWKSIESQLLKVEKPRDREISQWMNYGNQLWRYGRYEEAISAFEKVIELDERFDKAYYAIGLAYVARGDEYYGSFSYVGGVDVTQRDVNQRRINYQQALKAFKKAIEINDRPSYYWRYLGTVYITLEKYELAIDAYNRAITKNEGNRDFILYLLRGGAYFSQAYELRGFEVGQEQLATTEYNQALADYSQAIEINPNQTLVYNTRGFVYFLQQKYDLALADYNKALEINPNHIQAYMLCFGLYWKQEKYDLAIQYIEKVRDLSEQQRDMQSYQSAIQLLQALKYDSFARKKEEGFTDLSEAIETNSNDAQAYIARGMLYQQQQKEDLALADYNKAIEINPNNTQAYMLCFFIYFGQEKYGLAKQYIETARDLFEKQGNMEGYQSAIELLKFLKRLEN